MNVRTTYNVRPDLRTPSYHKCRTALLTYTRECVRTVHNVATRTNSRTYTSWCRPTHPLALSPSCLPSLCLLPGRFRVPSSTTSNHSPIIRPSHHQSSTLRQRATAEWCRNFDYSALTYLRLLTDLLTMAYGILHHSIPPHSPHSLTPTTLSSGHSRCSVASRYLRQRVALRCVAFRFVALRCVALRCVALRCVALRCVALR